MEDFDWGKYSIPVQDDFLDVENINPAEAYRRQAWAINVSGPLFAELEQVDDQLSSIRTKEKRLRTKILSQNMPLPSTSTRTNDLVDAFIYNKAENYSNEEGEIHDLRPYIDSMQKEIAVLENRRSTLERRLKAVEGMADKCDRIMNFAKHQARIELGRI